MPIRATQLDACYDVSCLTDVTLVQGKNKIDTGLIVDYIPAGWEIQVRPRSSLSAKGLSVAFGTVDAGYRDKLWVVMYCPESMEGYYFPAGSRIAQFAFREVPDVTIVDTTDGFHIVEQPTADRNGGFGSTGV